jgi:hypothetical protein
MMEMIAMMFVSGCSSGQEFLVLFYTYPLSGGRNIRYAEGAASGT